MHGLVLQFRASADVFEVLKSLKIRSGLYVKKALEEQVTPIISRKWETSSQFKL